MLLPSLSSKIQEWIIPTRPRKQPMRFVDGGRVPPNFSRVPPAPSDEGFDEGEDGPEEQRQEEGGQGKDSLETNLSEEGDVCWLELTTSGPSSLRQEDTSAADVSKQVW